MKVSHSPQLNSDASVCDLVVKVISCRFEMSLIKNKSKDLAMILVLTIHLLVVQTEEVYFNGTHRLKDNQTKIEVTTVKIAEVLKLKNNSTNTRLVVKEKTAKHFVNLTPKSNIVLIPPAKTNAQIVHKKNFSVQHRVA